MASPSRADDGDPGRVPAPDAGWLRAVAEEVRSFDRSSTAERVAELLRHRVIEGDLPPGHRLSEEQLVDVLHVSRNTLREAFRLLTHEGLLVHRLHRGVFVPELAEDDLVDLYRLRPLHDDVAAGEDAARRGDWVAVGTANMRFHQHLVALAGSRRIDETATRLLAELRLAFHSVGTPQRLHEPYVGRNRALLDLFVAGATDRAAEELEDYLHDSEAELLAAFRDRSRRTP
jgi:DNA-binding GntR family transcriptional regulator